MEDISKNTKNIKLIAVVCVILVNVFLLFGIIIVALGSVVSADILPTIEDEYLLEYKQIGELTNISWIDMVTIDTVRYEKDFANVNISDTAFDFLIIEYVREEMEEYCVRKDEKGKCLETDYEWVTVEERTLMNKRDIFNHLESMGYKTKGWTVREVAEAYNAIGQRENYEVRFSSRDIDELIEDFTEEQREWVSVLISENLVFQVIGESYDLPTHIPVVGNVKFAWPTPTLNKVTSPFGWRIDPKYGDKRFHYGIDIAGPGAMGQPVISIANGAVVQVSYSNPVSGMYVTVKHIDDEGHEWSSRYCHLSQINVRVGQIVNQGDVVGAVGSTGKSTGPHLHFEIKYQGGIVDPYPYVK